MAISDTSLAHIQLLPPATLAAQRCDIAALVAPASVAPAPRRALS